MLYVPMWVVEVIWWLMRWNELIWGTTYNNEATIDWLVSDSVYEWRCNRMGCSYFAVTVHQRDFYASTQSRNWDSVKTTRSSSPAPGSSAQVCITRHDTTWHPLKSWAFKCGFLLIPQSAGLVGSITTTQQETETTRSSVTSKKYTREKSASSR